jgi:hypothetical protein
MFRSGLLILSYRFALLLFLILPSLSDQSLFMFGAGESDRWLDLLCRIMERLERLGEF